jgi:hypothetical protein
MSNKTVVTKKGNVLPIGSIKGKDYLPVAYRLQWLSDDAERYNIQTEYKVLTADETLTKATITIFDEKMMPIRIAQASKRETKENFHDHTEKSETGAIGRALAMLGYGTQQATAELDEEDRIVDAPLNGGSFTVETSDPSKLNGTVKIAQQNASDPFNGTIADTLETTPKSKVSSFRNTKSTAPAKTATGNGKVDILEDWND